MVKKFIKIILAFVLAATPAILLSLPAQAALGANLISNSSVETVSGGNPTAWNKGGWGNNTAVLSLVTGDAHTGTNSLKTQITSISSGDAKWFANSVAVTAGKTYTYSDWNKATVGTYLVAQYQSTGGAYSYAWMVDVPASANWQQTSFDLTVPAGTANVTVFHVLDSVGTLQTDDASLAEVIADPDPDPIPQPANNLILNPSFENSTSGNPTSWSKASWGSNNASFTYLNSGAQDGSRAARVQITSYGSGDAKWMPAAVNVTAGQTYAFSDYYQSTATSEVDVAVTMSNNSTQWFSLGALAAAANWTQFATNFTMPAGAVKASFVHLLYGVGTLTTDNYSLAPHAPGTFNRPLISLTFDDAWRNIYTNGLPKLQQYGFLSTQYLLTGVSNDRSYMTVAMMRAFRDAGHEIASHTVDHYDLTTLNNTQLIQQLSNSKQWLQTNLGVTPLNFATPYGAYNTTVINAIKQYYSSNRNVDDGYNSKDNFNLYNIRCEGVISSTSLAEVNTWIAEAKATKSWLVLLYHQVGGNGTYNVRTNDLDAQLNAIKQSGTAVVTVQQALNELKPQL